VGVHVSVYDMSERQRFLSRVCVSVRVKTCLCVFFFFGNCMFELVLLCVKCLTLLCMHKCVCFSVHVFVWAKTYCVYASENLWLLKIM